MIDELDGATKRMIHAQAAEVHIRGALNMVSLARVAHCERKTKDANKYWVHALVCALRAVQA